MLKNCYFDDYAHMNKGTNLPKIDLAGVAARVNAVRITSGLTRDAFSLSFGLDPSSYSKIVGGKGKPLKSEHAYALAERWGVSMDFIYRGDLTKMDEETRAKIMQALNAPME